MSKEKKRGQLIIISGPPGAGKSTLSRKLSKEFGLFLIDKDLIDEPFSPNERGDIYTQNIEPKVLQSMLSLARENVGLNHSIILDLPLSHILLNSPEWIERFLSIDSLRLPIILELFIDEHTLKKRIENRALERDKIKLTTEGWRYFKQTDRIGEVNPLPHFLIDATRSRDDMFQDARAILSSNLHI